MPSSSSFSRRDSPSMPSKHIFTVPGTWCSRLPLILEWGILDSSAKSLSRMILEMTNIEKSFGELNVLKDISLTVDKGEVVSVIGPSGSGKSTLLRCATFLETIDSGGIRYQDKAAAWTEDGRARYLPAPELRKVKSCCGLVFQQFNLFPHYTVLKNIMDAPLSVQKRTRAEAEAEARALLDKMGLADKADAYPCQLSGGQQQRVAIARALAMSAPRETIRNRSDHRGYRPL